MYTLFLERHYVEVVVSKQEKLNNVLQDKIYAFYKEKNKDTDMYSGMWLPFVSQVCMVSTNEDHDNYNIFIHTINV